MLTIRTAAIALALFVAAPAAAQTQSSQVEVDLAHGFLDSQLDYALRTQLGSINSFLKGDEGFTPPELTAIQAAYSRELENTIDGAQDMVAKAAADAFTEAELRNPASIPNEGWEGVLTPLQDQLYGLGATLGAKAILDGCTAVASPSDACKAYAVIARDFLEGDITIEDLQK